MSLYRAQILLEDAQHDGLLRLARDSGRSMSELVREMLTDYLARAAAEDAVRRSLAALDGLAGLRHDIEQRHGPLLASWLDGLLNERDAELVPGAPAEDPALAGVAALAGETTPAGEAAP
jgi:hypothetical protein